MLRNQVIFLTQKITLNRKAVQVKVLKLVHILQHCSLSGLIILLDFSVVAKILSKYVKS